jgi:hypothetical protein
MEYFVSLGSGESWLNSGLRYSMGSAVGWGIELAG